MSAPDTNIEKQEERHKAPLIGIPAAVGLALAAFLAVVAWSELTGREKVIDFRSDAGTQAEATRSAQ